MEGGGKDRKVPGDVRMGIHLNYYFICINIFPALLHTNTIMGGIIQEYIYHIIYKYCICSNIGSVLYLTEAHRGPGLYWKEANFRDRPLFLFEENGLPVELIKHDLIPYSFRSAGLLHFDSDVIAIF